jgi:acetylornithine deacetylase/succinyl-diaminopimelate desuccinylase-like protein
VTNPGGHSSQPRKDNAIYHLAEGLSRLAKFDFPVRLFDVTRTNFERAAPLYPGQLGEDLQTIVEHPNNTAAVARLSAKPLYNALLRTTCVPTMLTGGHAENALPQSATAVVNCRLLPVDKAADVQHTLTTVLADPAIKLTVLTPARASKYVPMNQKVLGAVTSMTAKHWPGLPVIPTMSTGASDGVYLNVAGIPTYGVSGIFGDQDDVRAHGRDERVMVQSFYDAVDFIYGVAVTLGK